MRDIIFKKVRWFTGRFWAILAFHQIIGNLMSYAILVSKNSSNENLTVDNDTLTEGKIIQCGAASCSENADVIPTENFQVADNLRYGLFAGYLLLQIFSTALHKVFLRGFNDDGSQVTDVEFRFGQCFGKILRHMKSPLQILLAPMNIFSGMMMGLIFGDITRSFISCTLGVEQVGLAMTLFGATNAIGSATFQRLSGRIDRRYFGFFFPILEASLLVVTLTWNPSDKEGTWMIYIIAACFGYPDGIRQSYLGATYPEFFVGNEAVAFSMLPLLTSTGYAISYAIGDSICIFTKSIIVLSALAFSVLCIAAAELLHYRKISGSENQQINDVEDRGKLKEVWPSKIVGIKMSDESSLNAKTLPSPLV